MKNNYLVNFIKTLQSILVSVILVSPLLFPSTADAFPVFAQQAYENPIEATGRIVCANCHLAQKPVEIEVPQGVLPDTVFEATVEIPYNLSVKQREKTIYHPRIIFGGLSYNYYRIRFS